MDQSMKSWQSSSVYLDSPLCTHIPAKIPFYQTSDTNQLMLICVTVTLSGHHFSFHFITLHIMFTIEVK